MGGISLTNGGYLVEDNSETPLFYRGETHIEIFNTLNTLKVLGGCRLLTRRHPLKPEERKSGRTMRKRLGFYRLSARMALKGAETGLGRLGGIKASIYTLQVARSLRGVFAPLARGITNKEEI